jgi:DNA-binding MarR family transcriptional regulator
MQLFVWPDARSPIIANKREGTKSHPENTAGDAALHKDARDLHGALSELLRVYQFRDRKRICYYDVSVTQCYAISALLGTGPMTLNALAAGLYLNKSTASRVVDTLEEKDYVRRLVDPNDGRALKLQVTRKGRALHSRIEADLVNEMKQLLTDFDPDVRQATVRLVARFARTAKTRFSCAAKPDDSEQ